jgi:CheY-like chemotaxis protein
MPTEPAMAAHSPEADLRRILVVEDNLLVADVLCDMLTDRGLHVVGPCARLSKALALVAEETIDAAFLDINLAGEYCFPIADLLHQKGVPFAFLTGYADGSVIPAACRDVPVLTKPVNPLGIFDVMVRYFGPAFSNGHSGGR